MLHPIKHWKLLKQLLFSITFNKAAKSRFNYTIYGRQIQHSDTEYRRLRHQFNSFIDQSTTLFHDCLKRDTVLCNCDHTASTTHCFWEGWTLFFPHNAGRLADDCLPPYEAKHEALELQRIFGKTQTQIAHEKKFCLQNFGDENSWKGNTWLWSIKVKHCIELYSYCEE